MTRLPKSVYNMVVAVASDYGRMKNLLEKGIITREQAMLFTRYISAIDNAIIAVCSGEDDNIHELLRFDIAERRGFENSHCMKYYTTKYMFESRKNEAIVLIARMLGFI